MNPLFIVVVCVIWFVVSVPTAILVGRMLESPERSRERYINREVKKFRKSINKF